MKYKYFLPFILSLPVLVFSLLPNKEAPPPKVVNLPEEWAEFKPGDSVTVEHRNDTLFISFGGDATILY